MVKVSKQAFFYFSGLSIPCLIAYQALFLLGKMSERGFLCGDELPSCLITTQITENRYQFIAVWFGKGINPTLCLYGVSLVVKPLFGDLWFTVWVTLQSKSFRAQCAEGRMFDPFAQKGDRAALL